MIAVFSNIQHQFTNNQKSTNWNILFKGKDVFNEKPIILFKRNKNIQELIRQLHFQMASSSNASLYSLINQILGCLALI